MAKSAGKAPLGHSPFGKEKLEGPKVHHDDHGSKDSVPGKGKGIAVPADHWEKRYSMNDVHDKKGLAGSDWNAKVANTRTCTHTKVNREDH